MADSSFTFNSKRAALAALVMLTLLFCLDRALALALDRLLREQFVGPYAQADFTIHGMRQQVVVVGSSRAQRHYVPSIIRRRTGRTCFNAGRDGQGLIYASALVHLLIKRYRPTLVIFDLGNTDLQSSPATRARISALAPYRREFPDLAPFLDSRDGWEPYRAVSHAYAYNSKVIDLVRYQLLPFLAPLDDNGYLPLNGKLSQSDREQTPAFKPEEPDPAILGLLAATLGECKAHGIAVAGVFSPNFQDTRDCPSRRALDQAFARQGFPIYDFTWTEPFREAPGLFADLGHLNRDGAEKFTQQLCDSALLKGVSWRPPGTGP